jgi:hypothetical protein
MKTFYTQNSVGYARYIVNFHDGEKTHQDGSAFFDIRIFSNKRKVATFCKGLLAAGYTEKR